MKTNFYDFLMGKYAKVKKTEKKVALANAKPVADLLTDSRHHIVLIGIFARIKGYKFISREHQTQFIKRNARPANRLIKAGYDSKRLIEVMKYLKARANFKWTLETVEKYIDEDLNELDNLESKGKSKKAKFI